jgi:hypothetical protein
MSDQWLSIIEYARRFNISDMTVRRRIKTGKLQAVLREGKYYIPATSVEMAPQHHRPQQPQPAIVKSRPTMQSHPDPIPTYETAPVRSQSRTQAQSSNPHFVPHHISSQIHENSQRPMVDANTLLAFCEGALKKFSDAEIRLEQQYQQKISQLEAQLQAKHIEINQLSQQVEDLQVLVKILERKAGKVD